MRGRKLPKKKKMSINKIMVLDQPEYIYIPLIVGNDTDITVIPKVGDYIYKGGLIGNSKGTFKTYIHSSISGRVTSIEDKTYVNNQKVKCMVIENDFKDEVENLKGIKKNISEYSKEEFIDTIKKAGIVGMGGAGFPTYVKYDTDTHIKTLIVNAVECEPYITADYMLIKTKIKEILEAIDAILEINKIDECIIGIKKTNLELISLISQYIGTYLKIRIELTPNLYPMGWERSLIKCTTGLTYDKLPIEQGIVVNNVSTIYAIYEALKTNTPIMERIVTITGSGIKNSTNVLVRIGTPLKTILDALEYKCEDINLIAGGPMMGIALSNDDAMVTKQLNCVILMPLKETVETQCMRCGKCTSVCPAKLAPVLIKDNLNNAQELKKLQADKCIECGLCSYICPAKINLREYVRKAKGIIKESK